MLAFAIDDSTLGQIVRRKLDPDLIARDNSDEVLPHPAGDVRHHFRSRVQLDPEPRIGERLCNGALDFEGLFFFSQNQTSTEEKLSARRRIDVDVDPF